MTQKKLISDLKNAGVTLAQYRTAWKTGHAAKLGDVTMAEFVKGKEDSFECIYMGFEMNKQKDGIDWYAVSAKINKELNK